MNNKKMTIIRLVIFYTLAIVPLIILSLVGRHLLGTEIYSEEGMVSMLASSMGVFGMCTPAVANFLTRLITREGLKDSYLSLNMRKGKWKYYLLAIGIPLFYTAISVVLILTVLCGDAEQWFDTEDFAMKFWAYFSMIGTTFLCFLPFFGEEFGWRAYMTPKLEQLMPMPAALLVSGILWGLWHAPLTIQGHNFGLDYDGFPYLGILLMCVMCTLDGIILTYLTKRTGSVIPAAIMHGINNQMSFGVFIMLFASEEVLEIYAGFDIIRGFCLMLIPIALIAIVCFVLLCRDEKKAKAK